MKRLPQIILILSFLCFSWLAMQAVHELGHVFAAMATGATVDRVVLHPFTISRTDLAQNPHPLPVVWGGPLVGVALPLLFFVLWQRCSLPAVYLPRFFAGFCLVANGVYIAAGSFSRLADAGDMLRHGSPHWLLLLFGVATVPSGVYLWHGLGPNFGLGEARGKIDHRALLASVALLLVIAGGELAIGSR